MYNKCGCFEIHQFKLQHVKFNEECVHLLEDWIFYSLIVDCFAGLVLSNDRPERCRGVSHWRKEIFVCFYKYNLHILLFPTSFSRLNMKVLLVFSRKAVF